MTSQIAPRPLGADPVARAALLALGCALGLIALAAVRLAGVHMAQLGAICGQAAAPHCAWCVVAAAAAVASGVAFAAAITPALRRA